MKKMVSWYIFENSGWNKILFNSNIVIVINQCCDEMEDAIKYFCGTFFDYTFFK